MPIALPAPRYAPDARLALALALLVGSLIWKAPLLALVVYMAAVGVFFYSHALHRRAAAGTLRRTVQFVLFWPLLKLAVTGAELLVEGQAGGALALAVQESAILALRLGVLMGVGLCLTLALSPYAMGQGFVFFLRPFLRKSAWQVALALTLMIQTLPRIHSALASMRLAAQARGLPASGWRYYRMAVPRLLRALATQPYNQAVAVSLRQLDSPAAWENTPPFSPGSVAKSAAIAAGAVLLLFLH